MTGCRCWSITSAVQRRAGQESRAIEDRNKGLRNKPCELSSRTERQTHQQAKQPEMETRSTPARKRKSTNKPSSQRWKPGQHLQDTCRSSPAGATLSMSKTSSTKTCPRNQNHMLPRLSKPVQGETAHLTLQRNTYKRRASTQFDSIQFCNGCSPKMNYRVVFNKIRSVKPPSFIS
jgi:hypothetical protein